MKKISHMKTTKNTGKAVWLTIILGLIMFTHTYSERSDFLLDSSFHNKEDMEPQVLFPLNSKPVIYFLDQYYNRTSCLRETENPVFTVVVEAVNINDSTIDTINVYLSTASGDMEIIPVIETEKSTNVYVSEEIPFYFLPNISLNNGSIEGSINFCSADNRIEVLANIRVAEGNIFSNLELRSAYIPVDSAWITDGNGDGQADFIVVRFRTSLPYPPSAVSSIDWPTKGRNRLTAHFDSNLNMSEITFFPNYDNDYDSSLVVIHLNDTAFRQGDTKVSESNPASITLPDDVVFRWQAPLLADKINPIISQASRHLGSRNVLIDGTENNSPDTLLVTFSEKLYPLSMVPSLWDSLLNFSPSGSSAVYPIINFRRPVPLNSDSLTWIFVVSSDSGNKTPTCGDEVRINPQAPFTDLAGNPPGWHGDILKTSRGNIQETGIRQKTVLNTQIVTAAASFDD